MKNEEENKTSYSVMLSRILVIVLLPFLIAIVLGCNTTGSQNGSRNKGNLTVNDSIEADLIDPEILYKRAEGYYVTGKLQQASNTLNQIIKYYYNYPKNPAVAGKALKLLSKVEKAINLPLSSTTTSTTSTYSNKYIVKADVIFAATSEANYNTMMNCIVSGDKQAVGTMVLTGQVKYLYKNNVVYLVKAKFKYFIVRPEGSTENLYVVGEQLSQN